MEVKSASITGDESIYLRILKNGIEYHLEYFYDYDFNDVDDLECTLHVYKGGEKEVSYFGRTKDMIDIIKIETNEN